jgi:hypothetical protein
LVLLRHAQAERPDARDKEEAARSEKLARQGAEAFSKEASAENSESAVLLNALGTGKWSDAQPAVTPMQLPGASLLDLEDPDSGVASKGDGSNADDNPGGGSEHEDRGDNRGDGQGGVSQDESQGGGEPEEGHCGGVFGDTLLNEKMTVVSLDPPGGCIPGQTASEFFVYFVGGNLAHCRPMPETAGCRRFIIARYGEKCDLGPLHNYLGQSSPIGGELFDEDGLYKKCNEKPLLQMRTVRYKGIGQQHCSDEFCATPPAKQSAATRGSSMWVLSFLTAVFFERSR